MNIRLVSRSLGIVALLIGASMLFSLPWAFPQLGRRAALQVAGSDPGQPVFELAGFLALLASVAVCVMVGGALLWMGRRTEGRMYRKEALAVVGLSWVLATVLGALPYYFVGVYRCSSVRLHGPGDAPFVYALDRFRMHRQWLETAPVAADEYAVLKALQKEGARGLSPAQLAQVVPDGDGVATLENLMSREPVWASVVLKPNAQEAPDKRVGNYRFRWVQMGLADALFESQSGFSTTGATVISDLEDPQLVPHCILFWRSTTHFLGGLGIIVVFVSILGRGSAGKALMRAEMPGPTKEGSTERMQQTAWLFAAVYLGLNAVLAIILKLAGLSLFDALCHSFGTMATGGFSTYNASVGHFADYPHAYNRLLIESAITLFMVLAGTNFTLLYLCLIRQPGALLRDVEWRTYVGLIGTATTVVVVFGLLYRDFGGLGSAIRYGLFQVVSIVTTTGFGTHDFDKWNSLGRAVLFVLMFVGGCAGSTGGGMKVIRHILLLKILRQEVELAAHPTVVRPLRLGGKTIADMTLRKNVLVYGCLIAVIFVSSWVFVVAVEPPTTWGTTLEHKLIDSASGVAATLNNIGPGLGIVGASRQYTNFSPTTKLLFVGLMMLGRLELFPILVLFSVRFWRSF